MGLFAARASSIESVSTQVELHESDPNENPLSTMSIGFKPLPLFLREKSFKLLRDVKGSDRKVVGGVFSNIAYNPVSEDAGFGIASVALPIRRATIGEIVAVAASELSGYTEEDFCTIAIAKAVYNYTNSAETSPEEQEYIDQYARMAAERSEQSRKALNDAVEGDAPLPFALPPGEG